MMDWIRIDSQDGPWDIIRTRSRGEPSSQGPDPSHEGLPRKMNIINFYLNKVIINRFG